MVRSQPQSNRFGPSASSAESSIPRSTPLPERSGNMFGVSATARASLGCYNTREELDALVRGLHTAIKFLR